MTIKLLAISFVLLSGFHHGALANKLDGKTIAERELKAIRQTASSGSTDRINSEAKLTYWLALYTDDPVRKRALLEEGLKLSESIQAETSNDPQALLVWTAIMGELLQQKSKVVAITYLKPLERAAKKLKALDPAFGHYAGDRILGRLYQLAPPFISIGSKRKSREHFETAMKGDPTYPENMILYADFLRWDGQKEKSLELIKAAMKSPTLEKYPLERHQWELQAQFLLNEWTNHS